MSDGLTPEPPQTFDFAAMVADLNALLRLKTTVIGMKMFATAAEMEAIPKIRRPNAIHTTDQIVSMASRLGWTVGITAADLKLTVRGAGKRAVSAPAAKPAVKYRSPTGETWSGGRGRKPRWVNEALAAGKSLSEFEVN